MSILWPVKFSVILVLNVITEKFHGVSSDTLGPRVGGCNWGDGVVGERVCGAEDIEISFEGKDVVVHRTGKTVMNVIT